MDRNKELRNRIIDASIAEMMQSHLDTNTDLVMDIAGEISAVLLNYLPNEPKKEDWAMGRNREARRIIIQGAVRGMSQTFLGKMDPKDLLNAGIAAAIQEVLLDYLPDTDTAEPSPPPTGETT